MKLLLAISVGIFIGMQIVFNAYDPDRLEREAFLLAVNAFYTGCVQSNKNSNCKELTREYEKAVIPKKVGN